MSNSVQSQTDLKPPSTETGGVTSLHSREVDYALILSQMISLAEDDPSQLRLAIYEFARTKLKHNTSFAHDVERRQLSDALEAAILGVEKFSSARDEHRRAQFERTSARAIDDSSLREHSHSPLLGFRNLGTSFDRTSARVRSDFFMKGLPKLASNRWAHASKRVNWFAVGLSLVVLSAGVAFIVQNKSFWRTDGKISATATSGPFNQNAAPSATVSAGNSGFVAPSVALPSDYGVYVLISGNTWVELHALGEKVPDKRVAMSTPIAQPSETTLPDGNAKFFDFPARIFRLRAGSVRRSSGRPD